MTTLELLEEIRKAPAFMGGSDRYKSVAGSDILYNEDIERIRRDLEVLEILKPRINLKPNTIKHAHYTINEHGLPEIESDFKDVEVAFIEASGFVVKDSEEHKLLKEWLEND